MNNAKGPAGPFLPTFRKPLPCRAQSFHTVRCVLFWPLWITGNRVKEDGQFGIYASF